MFAILSQRFSLFYKLPKSCVVLLLFSFLECAAGGIIYYLSLYLGTSTPLSKLQIGQVGSIVGLGSLLGSLFATYLTDKINNKKIIAVSFLCLGLGFLGLPNTMNFKIISLHALMIAIATNTFLTANNTLLLKTAPQDPDSLRMIQSMKVVSENLGNSCSMALIMFFAAQYYGQIFEGIGLFFLLFALNAAKYLKSENNTHLPSKEKNIEQLNNKRLIYVIVSAVFIIGVIYAQQRIAYPLFLNETFGNFTTLALLFWLDPIMVSLFQFKVSQMASSLKVYYQLAIGGLLLGGGLFVLMFVQNLVEAVLACLIFILGEMLFMPTSFVQCYELAGAKYKGWTAGIWRSAYSSGLIMGPVLSGFLLEHYHYTACWILSGILGLFILSIFLIIPGLNKIWRN
ncbi:TPA: MFS transporter [Legionella pneumophila]|nr:MFS transporter [Legionella pneumophila]HAU1321347.1 MFS transporter [Legionella pneumophila]HBC0468145.1 MFS transporter [Legionella pneumophila]HBD9375638.1 MFS transporter [Legionella pneumophila]HBI2946979.1 MFS transporter [Legionella pneumophila]